MNKKFLSITLIVIMLVSSMFALTGCGKKSGDDSNNEKNEIASKKDNDSSYIKKYEKYLNETFFSDENASEDTQLVGGLFDSYTTSDPFLAIKYKDKNNTYVMKIIHIAGDEVKTSSNFTSTGMNYAYNLERAKD